MDNICFIVSIRQRICQSGVPVYTDNTYTNISNSTQILLNNGYILTVYKISNDNLRLSFLNNSFNLSFSFDITDGSTCLCDLPIEGGTYKILVFASSRCCNSSQN